MPNQSPPTPTTECIPRVTLKSDGKKPLLVSFDAPNISSDAGLLLLRQMDDRLRLIKSMAAVLADQRDPVFVRHRREEQLRQRVFQIAMGYPDCNDADRLRHDPLLKTVCDASPAQPFGLSSQPTLSRFENAMDAASLQKIAALFEQQYVQSLPEDTTHVILDIDTTDDPTHGQQQLTFYHGFYEQHMYHPLMVFDASTGELITVLLRPGNAHSSRSAMLILRRVIRLIKARFPAAHVLVRGDGGFCVPRILLGLEELNTQLQNVDYLFGIAQNSRLLTLGGAWIQLAAGQHAATEEHVRLFGVFRYAAASWPRERRIIIKAEHAEKGSNPRFIVTSSEESQARDWYEAYCARGQCENWIKDFKNAVFADRLSCSSFVANAFRLWLHAMAYRLMHALRTECCSGLQMACMQLDTLRLRLIKVAAIVTESARRILVRLPKAFPWAQQWAQLSERLQT